MLADFLSMTTGVGMLLSWVLGFALKRWPAFRNGFIPVVTAIVAIITQAVNYAAPPPPADVSALSHQYLTAGFFDGITLQVIINAVLQWLAVTGAHSNVKNVSQGLIAMRDEKV